MTSFWLSTHPVADRATPLSPGAHYDIAVVGAGLTGLATAVMLATAGQTHLPGRGPDGGSGGHR